MMLEYVLKQVVECFMVVIVKKKVKILDGDFLGTCAQVTRTRFWYRYNGLSPKLI
jgi:hypothetical protein